MSDAQLPTEVPAPAPAPGPAPSLITATLVVYGLFGLAAVVAILSNGLVVIAPLVGLAGIVAIIVAYVKQGEAAGTWLASHYRWLIRTFWFSMLWGVIGTVLVLTLIGIPFGFAIWIATSIWVLYRLIRGYLMFKDSKPIPGM